MNNTVLKGLFLLWLGHFSVDFCLGIWPIYKTLAAFDIAAAGLVMSVCAISGEFLQIFWGGLCDRGHRKKVLLSGVLLSSSILLITHCKTILSCYLVLQLMMLGSGTFHPAAVGSASRLVPAERKNSAVLFFASGGALGWAISQLCFTNITHLFGGHATLLFLLYALVTLLIYSFPIPESSSQMRFNFKTLFQPLWQKKRLLMPLYFAQVCNQAIVSSLVFLLPDILRAKAAHPWICYGGGHLCLILGAACIAVPAGLLSDRYGPKPVLLTILTTGLGLLYFFLSQDGLSLPETSLLLFFLGAFIFTPNPMAVSWGNIILPEHPSTVSGLLMGLAWCVGYAGPAVTGLLVKSTASPQLAIATMGLTILISFFLILSMPKQTAPARELV